MSRALASNSSALAKVKVRRAGMIWERILNIPGFPSIASATSAGKLSTSSTVSVRTWKYPVRCTSPHRRRNLRASRKVASGNVTMTFQSAATSIASAIRPSLRRFTHLSTRWGWRLRCRLCRAGEKIGHFGVAHLMEIAIVEANCSQHHGHFEADGLVGLLAELGERLRRRYRDGEHQMRRIAPPHRAQRHPHRRASGNAVIDDDRGAAGDCDWRAARAVAPAAPLDLLELARRLFLHIAFRYVQGFDQILVDEGLRARPVGDGAKSELRLPGYPDFAHEHDVERCVERLGNLETDGNAAARQCQDHRRPVFEMGQFGGQLAPGRAAIGEFHVLASVKCFKNQPRACSTTASSVPGSSKRCVAPGTMTSCFAQRSAASAARLSASTSTSSPPTISKVGASTAESARPARSGRPPRETIAAIGLSCAASATSAAAAPVLAPKYPT